MHSFKSSLLTLSLALGLLTFANTALCVDWPPAGSEMVKVPDYGELPLIPYRQFQKSEEWERLGHYFSNAGEECVKDGELATAEACFVSARIYYEYAATKIWASRTAQEERSMLEKYREQAVKQRIDVRKRMQASAQRTKASAHKPGPATAKTQQPPAPPPEKTQAQKEYELLIDGQGLLWKKDYKAAIVPFEALRKLHPDNPQVLTYLARCDYELLYGVPKWETEQQVMERFMRFRGLVKDATDNVSKMANAAQDLAMLRYQYALKLGGLHELDKAIEIWPGARLLIDRSRLRVKKNVELDKVEADLEQVATAPLLPNSGEYQARKMHDLEVAEVRGELAERRGEYEKAKKEYQALRFTNDPMPCIAIARCYFALATQAGASQPRETVESNLKAVSDYLYEAGVFLKNNPKAATELALIMGNYARYKQDLAAMNEAVAVWPGAPLLLMRAGFFLREGAVKEDLDKAEADLNAIATAPKPTAWVELKPEAETKAEIARLRARLELARKPL
jgi:tetratricopeptide (TPR) repeat protein